MGELYLLFKSNLERLRVSGNVKEPLPPRLEICRIVEQLGRHCWKGGRRGGRAGRGAESKDEEGRKKAPVD